MFRTEGFAGCNLGKALIAEVVGTSYTANGPSGATFTWNVTYWYVVKAYGGGWTSANSAAVSNRTPKKANCT